MTSILLPRAAGVVPARRTADGWQLLVVKAQRAWEFPNGPVNPDEDPLEVAQRHTREETGLADLSFPYGPVYREPAPNARHGKYPRYYLGVTAQEQVALRPADNEKRPRHEEARWVSFDEASRLLPQRLSPTLNWARRVLCAV